MHCAADPVACGSAGGGDRHDDRLYGRAGRRSRRQRVFHRAGLPANHEAHSEGRPDGLSRAQQQRQRDADRSRGAVDRVRGGRIPADGGAADVQAASDPNGFETGKIEVLADNYQGKPFVGPNDVTIDSKGRLYFTDLTGGAVYRLDAPGQIVRILSTPEIQRPNGIQISPDDSTLYLIEANGAQGGARMIRAYDLRPDGTVANMRVHYNFYPGPQRRWHEHRLAGQSLRVGGHGAAAWNVGDARHENRHLRHLAARARC